jgi:hypothetical protein
MIKDLAPEYSRFQVTEAPFEESPVEESGFDVAFTSPPYFDFEEYGLASSSQTSQSIVRYPDVGPWVSGFLIPMMQKASASLRMGGYLAINIEGQYMYGVLDKGFVQRGMEYQGIIGYSSDDPSDNRIHPIFVWRRVV